MPSETSHSSTDNLRDQVQRWVSAGVVTAQEGEGILRFEHAAAGGHPAVGAQGTVALRRLSPVAELVSYLGIVLVLVSGGLSVSRLWQSLGPAGRIAVGVVVAGLGFIGGRAISRLGDESTTRLGWFLWLCGTGGVAMATAVLTDRVSGHSSGWTMLMAGVVVLAVSVCLWRNLERPLQFLSSVVGFGFTVAGVCVLANWHPNTATVGALFWIPAAGLGLLAREVIRPSLVATIVAQAGLFAGAMSMTTSSRALGVTLGLVGAAAGVALGLSTRRTLVTTAGVLSFFVFVIRLLSFYLKGPGTTLVAFLLGVGLVGVVIWRATRAGKGARDEEEAGQRRKDLVAKPH